MGEAASLPLTPLILTPWAAGQDARTTWCGHLARIAHARRMHCSGVSMTANAREPSIQQSLWKRGASDAGYHYLGCAKTFALMGKTFAEAAASMQKK